MNLHYSQTTAGRLKNSYLFYHPMNLHYSQTQLEQVVQDKQFYHPMNLHYSQTVVDDVAGYAGVLPSYEFTLLSNRR